MATLKQKITPCLWFDTQAEDAAKFYTSVFKNSAIKQISRYGIAGHEVHGKAPGSVMTVEFEIEGQTFTALNGGPQFKFTEAVSFQVMCDTQAEIDEFWQNLSAGARKACAAGSRTNTGCRGRSCRRSCRNCWPTPRERGSIA